MDFKGGFLDETDDIEKRSRIRSGIETVCLSKRYASKVRIV